MKKALLIVAGAIVASFVALAGLGAVLSAGEDDPAAPKAALSTAFTSAPYQGVSPAAKPAVQPGLSAKDIQLKVKVKSKQCFGSAGCSLEYTIVAAAELSLLKGDCEVTYDVSGFDDGTQTGTLTMHEDGTYDQDSYQSGSTASSGKKLAVKVTDVVCS